MERVALRWWMPIVAVATVGICVATFRAPEQQTSFDGWGVETPPPPAQFFVILALATPAILTAGPLLIANEMLGGAVYIRIPLLLLFTGLFWFAVGYKMDAARGQLQDETVPKWVRIYLLTFRCISAVVVLLMFFGILIYRAHYGAPPLWSELTSWGIVFAWCFIGALPLLKHWRKPVECAYKITSQSADE